MANDDIQVGEQNEGFETSGDELRVNLFQQWDQDFGNGFPIMEYASVVDCEPKDYINVRAHVICQLLPYSPSCVC